MCGNLLPLVTGHCCIEYLNTYTLMNYKMNWSQENICCLKQNFPKMPDRELAKILEKSPNALRIKASRLGMNKEITIVRANLELSPIEEQVIIGGLLGDLSCRITHTSKRARLEGGHCLKQKEYMLWKISLMQKLMFKIRISKTGTYLYQSRCFEILNKYFNLFYQNGSKSVNKNILNLLNDFGLLIWYLDDGSYHKRNKMCYLYTNGFSCKEQDIIKGWFTEKYDITPKICRITDSKRHPGKCWYHLYFNVSDTKKLLTLFRKFEIPNCMKYKLGLN